MVEYVLCSIITVARVGGGTKKGEWIVTPERERERDQQKTAWAKKEKPAPSQAAAFRFPRGGNAVKEREGNTGRRTALIITVYYVCLGP